jgi:hypothetical protein
VCRPDPSKDSDSWDRVVTVLWCQPVSLRVASLQVIVISGLYASSGFGNTSCGRPPTNRPVNILIFQVPEDILISCKGRGLTKTSTLVFLGGVGLLKSSSRKEKKEVAFSLLIQ